MPAYIVVTAVVHEPEKFNSGYGAAAAELTERFGGEYLIRGSGAECLEGDIGKGAGMVVSKWPDRVAAKAFWNSPEYAEAKKLREGLADVQVMLIEGPDIST